VERFSLPGKALRHAGYSLDKNDNPAGDAEIFHKFMLRK
jgi:hypothetical protein